MQHLGEPVDYDFLMGVTGACFRRIWNRDDDGNVDLMYLSPEPHRRAFEALGYDYREIQRNKTAMVEAVKESIAREVPVISFGPVGPPEAGLVAGYSDEGNTLYGWSYFQDAKQPGYFEVEDWFDKMPEGPSFGLISVGGKRAEVPAKRDIFIHSLEWAVDLAHRAERPNLPEHICGLAAYDARAKSLDDPALSTDDAETARRRNEILDPMIWDLATRRHYGNVFLERAAELFPNAAEELNAARACFRAEHDMMWEINSLGGAKWPGQELPKTVDPDVRKQIAKLLLKSRDMDLEAAGHIEDALAKMVAVR